MDEVALRDKFGNRRFLNGLGVRFGTSLGGIPAPRFTNCSAFPAGWRQLGFEDVPFRFSGVLLFGISGRGNGILVAVLGKHQAGLGGKSLVTFGRIR